jgi:hypothetical protein
LSRENKTLRPKPQTLKYFYSLLPGKYWGDLPALDELIGPTCSALFGKRYKYVDCTDIRPCGWVLDSVDGMEAMRAVAAMGPARRPALHLWRAPPLTSDTCAEHAGEGGLDWIKAGAYTRPLFSST